MEAVPLRGEERQLTVAQYGARQRLEALAAAVAAALVVGASHLVRWLPPRARYLPADAITALVARVWGRQKIVAANFALALGLAPDDACARTLARASLRNFGHMAIDFLTARTMHGDELRRVVAVAGTPALRHGPRLAEPAPAGGLRAPTAAGPVPARSRSRGASRESCASAHGRWERATTMDRTSNTCALGHQRPGQSICTPGW
jgi:hypothetical protein